jgi:hypothetical protein
LKLSYLTPTLAVCAAQEDIRDLLMQESGAQNQVQIREVVGGGVCLAGATEREVSSKEEMEAILEQGSLLRATAATGVLT